MANINTRAKDETIGLLKNLADQTGDSQSQVIDKALKIYREFLELQDKNRIKILEKMV